MKINKDKIANSLACIIFMVTALQGAFHDLNEWQFWLGFVWFLIASALFLAVIFDEKGDIVVGSVNTLGLIFWVVIFCAFWVQLFLGNLSW